MTVEMIKTLKKTEVSHISVDAKWGTGGVSGDFSRTIESFSSDKRTRTDSWSTVETLTGLELVKPANGVIVYEDGTTSKRTVYDVTADVAFDMNIYALPQIGGPIFVGKWSSFIEDPMKRATKMTATMTLTATDASFGTFSNAWPTNRECLQARLDFAKFPSGDILEYLSSRKDVSRKPPFRSVAAGAVTVAKDPNRPVDDPVLGMPSLLAEGPGGKCPPELNEGDICATGICRDGKQTVFRCDKDKQCVESTSQACK
jgi:hypothetical protein